MICYNKEYVKYASDVISGKIVACENIKLSCERMFEFFERDDMYFDYEDVDRKIRFIGKLKHSTGQHAGKNFILLPWQQFCVANIFGFKWKETGYRVTKKVFIMISRKAGKTAFASALALCCSLCDNEQNAEVELVANSRQQAGIAFDHCRNFCESVDAKSKIFKCYKNKINIPKTKSNIQVLSSDAMGNDGYNAHCFILDEFHATKTWDLYNVMISSQGMRRQPLAIVITTAGFYLNSYPCYDYCKNCIEILKKMKSDDSQFSAIYQLDENDDWKDERNWIKCAPSLGQTVSAEYLRDQVISATNNTSLEVGIKTKNFNMWCQSKDVWVTNEELLNSMEKVNIDDYKDELSFMGVDLSSTNDITSFSILFPPNEYRDINPDKYVFKSFIYIPQIALENSSNSFLYNKWKQDGYVDVTSGNVVDYDYILMDQKKYSNDMLSGVYYDAWNATQWAINATTDGLPLEPYSQSLGNFNKPTKLFEILLKSNRIVIDYNPCVLWCFSNVELKYDHNSNCKPVKTKGDKLNKIDPVISMLEALGGYLITNNYEPTLISI